MEWEKVTIQKMDIKDLDEVFFLETSNPLPLWSKNMFIEEIKNPIAHCFVMKIDDGSKPLVIGFICFRNTTEESELLNLGVHPEYRQLGVGKRLMQFYIEFSSGRGIQDFYLEVHSSNYSAIHLYKSFSYQSSGMREKFYQGKFDALLMTKKV